MADPRNEDVLMAFTAEGNAYSSIRRDDAHVRLTRFFTPATGGCAHGWPEQQAAKVLNLLFFPESDDAH